jgi:hypothetical protein
MEGDKQPMQADGAGTRMTIPDENGEFASRPGRPGPSRRDRRRSLYEPA